MALDFFFPPRSRCADGHDDGGGPKHAAGGSAGKQSWDGQRFVGSVCRTAVRVPCALSAGSGALQVAQEAFSDGLLTAKELEATREELRQTYREQLLSLGVDPSGLPDPAAAEARDVKARPRSAAPRCRWREAHEFCLPCRRKGAAFGRATPRPAWRAWRRSTLRIRRADGRLKARRNTPFERAPRPRPAPPRGRAAPCCPQQRARRARPRLGAGFGTGVAPKT